MAVNPELGKFIPVRTEDLVEAICTEKALSEEDREKFRRVAELVEATYHYDFHGTLKDARSAYHIFNPDADTLKICPPDAGIDERFGKMVDALKEILGAANYREFPLSELNELMTKAAPRGLKVQVNLDKYEEILIYRRGKKMMPKAKDPISYAGSLLKKLFRKEAPAEPELEEVIQRLLIMIKLKKKEDLEQFYDTFIETAGETERERKRRMTREALLRKKERTNDASDSAPDNGPPKIPTIFLKVFKNVPVSSLETLFPDVNIQMTLIDKGFILLPVIGGFLAVAQRVIPAVLVIGTVIAALIAGRAIDWAHFKDQLFPILVAFSLVGAMTFKVAFKYRITKEKHQGKLMKTLYFHNLDNNAGVFDFLVHEAEEEECKEALLAYYFLLTERNEDGQPYTEEELDDRIEEWLEEKFGVHIDFEVDDALRKLEDKHILVKEGDRYLVPSIDDTLIKLDELWDTIFLYSNEAEAEAEAQSQA